MEILSEIKYGLSKELAGLNEDEPEKALRYAIEKLFDYLLLAMKELSDEYSINEGR